MKIRPCTDARELIPLAQAWQEESKGEKFNIDCDIPLFLQDCHNMIQSEGTAIFVADVDGKVVGMMGVEIVRIPFSHRVAANEHYWYFLKEYRGAASIRLLRHVMDACKGMGCTHFMATASAVANEHHDRICGIYQRMGMKLFETTYIAEIGG